MQNTKLMNTGNCNTLIVYAVNPTVYRVDCIPLPQKK